MNFFTRLTYQPGVLRVVRSLHLSTVLRKHYYRLKSASDGAARFALMGVEVKLYCPPTPVEFRALEGELVKEQHFLAALSSTLRPGDTFFDIGASIGLYSVPAAKIVGERGQVVAFEPEARAAEKLVAHAQLNGLSNIRLVRKALGEKEVEARLLVGGGACPSLLAHNGDPHQGDAVEVVEVVPGDRVLDAEKLAIPRALKIDVEGFEYSVLRGLAKTMADPHCVLLCCEIHPDFLPQGVTADIIAEYVKSLGFGRLESHPASRQIHLIAHK